MCLALFKPAGIKPEWDKLQNAMCANSDGAGFAVAVKGQLIVEKGFFKFEDLKKAMKPFMLHPMLVHFRLATMARPMPTTATRSTCVRSAGRRSIFPLP